jgi:hypothetical protein
MHVRYLVVPLAVVLSCRVQLTAQTAADITGHWEGAIHAPGREIAIEVDLGKGRNGELIGAFNNPGEKLTGFPLSDVAVDGRTVHFTLKAGSGGGPFKGVVSADGTTIDGDFTATTPKGPMTLPITLARKGEAHIEPPPINKAISSALEGEWRGTIDVNEKPMGVTLTLMNHPDGTSSGTAVSDGGNAEIPITTIEQNGPNVVLEMKIIGGVYSAALSADGAELIGSWTQAGFEAPLTFRRVRP